MPSVFRPSFYQGPVSSTIPFLIAYTVCALLLTIWQAYKFVSKYAAQSPKYLIHIVAAICGWELIHAGLTIASAHYYLTHTEITFESLESPHWGFISMYFATACSIAYIQILLVRLTSQSPGFCRASWLYTAIFAFLGWTLVAIFYPVFKILSTGELTKFAVVCAAATTAVDLNLTFRFKDLVDLNNFASNVMQERALNIARKFLLGAMIIRAVWTASTLAIFGSAARFSTLPLVAIELGIVEFLGNLYAPMFLYALNVFGIPPQEMIDAPEGGYINQMIPRHSRPPSPVELSTVNTKKSVQGVHRRTAS